MEQNETTVMEEVKFQEPHKWKVIFKNDNITPINFVVHILEEVFQLSNEKAVLFTLEVHHKGKAIVGVYYKSIAEMRQQTALEMAKKAGYPLQIELEQE